MFCMAAKEAYVWCVFRLFVQTRVSVKRFIRNTRTSGGGTMLSHTIMLHTLHCDAAMRRWGKRRVHEAGLRTRRCSV